MGANADEFAGSLDVRDGCLEIHMQGRSLDDRGADRWCAWARDNVPQYLRTHGIQQPSGADGFVTAREVNFSSNSIGDAGALALLRCLFNLRVGIKVLKLYRNNLGRAAAHALMDWLVVTPVPVIELHLSHNYIPREGAVDILKAVAHNPAYPPEARNGRGRVPLWLRLEHNIVANPDDLIATAEVKMERIFSSRARGGGTSSGKMLCYQKEPGQGRIDYSTADHCPLAQVTYLANQRLASQVRVPSEAQAWQARTSEREESARWRMMPATASRPAVPSAAPPSRPATSASADLASAEDGAVAPGDAATGSGSGAGAISIARRPPAGPPPPGPPPEAPMDLGAHKLAKAPPPAMLPNGLESLGLPGHLQGKAPPPGMEAKSPPRLVEGAPVTFEAKAPPIAFEAKGPPPSFEAKAPPPAVAGAAGSAVDAMAPPKASSGKPQPTGALAGLAASAGNANGVLARAIREAPIKGPLKAPGTPMPAAGQDVGGSGTAGFLEQQLRPHAAVPKEKAASLSGTAEAQSFGAFGPKDQPMVKGPLPLTSMGLALASGPAPPASANGGAPAGAGAGSGEVAKPVLQILQRAAGAAAGAAAPQPSQAAAAAQPAPGVLSPAVGPEEAADSEEASNVLIGSHLKEALGLGVSGPSRQADDRPASKVPGGYAPGLPGVAGGFLPGGFLGSTPSTAAPPQLPPTPSFSTSTLSANAPEWKPPDHMMLKPFAAAPASDAPGGAIGSRATPGGWSAPANGGNVLGGGRAPVVNSRPNLFQVGQVFSAEGAGPTLLAAETDSPYVPPTATRRKAVGLASAAPGAVGSGASTSAGSTATATAAAPGARRPSEGVAAPEKATSTSAWLAQQDGSDPASDLPSRAPAAADGHDPGGQARSRAADLAGSGAAVRERSPGLLDLEADHPPEVLKDEIRRLRRDNQELLSRLERQAK